MTFLDRLFGRSGGDLVEQQALIKRVITELNAGTDPADVEAELVRDGTPPRQARRILAHVQNARAHGPHLFDRS